MNTMRENAQLKEENRILRNTDNFENIENAEKAETNTSLLDKDNIVQTPPTPSKPKASSLPLIATVALGALAVGYWLGRR